jgi:hypothetical protein
MFNEMDENINTFIKTSQPWYRDEINCDNKLQKYL